MTEKRIDKGFTGNQAKIQFVPPAFAGVGGSRLIPTP
jgi:hypothetical protein